MVPARCLYGARMQTYVRGVAAGAGEASQGDFVTPL
jgi:hypothetical protein